MPELGPPMWWRLGLKNTVVADAAGAKESLNQIEQSGNRASGSLNVLDQATGKNARGLKSMGTVATMAGGSLMMMSSSMRDADGNITSLGNSVQAAGYALTGYGMISMMLPPIIRSIGFAHSVIIPAIAGHTVATISNTAATTAAIAPKAANAAMINIVAKAEAEYAVYAAASAAVTQLQAEATVELAAAAMVLNPTLIANAGASSLAAASEQAQLGATMGLIPAQMALAGAETVATGATYSLIGALDVLATATVVGIVLTAIAGTAYVLYNAWDTAQSGAKELEKQVKSLTTEIDILGQVQKAQSYETNIMEDSLKGEQLQADKLKDAIRDVTNELDDYNQATKEAKGLTNDLASAENRLKGYTWDMKDAREALAKAETPEDKARAKIRLDELRIQHDADLQNIKDLKDKITANDAVVASGDKEGGTVGLQQKLTEYLKAQSDLNERMAEQQTILNGLKEKELATNEQLAELNFEKYFLDMQKEGRALTAEQYTVFNADQSSPAAKALKNISPFIKQGIEWGTINADGTFKEGHGARTVTNPVFESTGVPFRPGGIEGRTWDRGIGMYREQTIVQPISVGPIYGKFNGEILKIENKSNKIKATLGGY